MFDYDREERKSWGLTLTQPSTTWNRLGGSFSFVKRRRRAATGRYIKLVIVFSDDLTNRLNKGRPQIARAV